MRKSITLLVLCVSFIGYTQKTSNIVENYGSVYKVEEPDTKFDTEGKYQVVFDIFKDTNSAEANEQLQDVANYITQQLEEGVLPENMNTIVILHGKASKNALNNSAYNKLFKTDNPNMELIMQLLNSKVKIYVGERTFTRNAFNKEDKISGIRLAVSATSTLTMFQQEGYQIINFN